jgi:hypothetical protein
MRLRASTADAVAFQLQATGYDNRRNKMSRRFLASGFACTLALVASVGAQSPVPTATAQDPRPQGSTGAQASAPAQAGMVTIEGCIIKEVDVPDRRPPDDVRSRVVTDDDYVLTSTKMIEGSAPPVKAADAPTGTTGTASPPLMYKVKDLGKAQLSEHAKHRVQITGTLNNIERAKLPVSFATDLVELRGTSIKVVGGECDGK